MRISPGVTFPFHGLCLEVNTDALLFSDEQISLAIVGEVKDMQESMRAYVQIWAPLDLDFMRGIDRDDTCSKVEEDSSI